MLLFWGIDRTVQAILALPPAIAREISTCGRMRLGKARLSTFYKRGGVHWRGFERHRI